MLTAKRAQNLQKKTQMQILILQKVLMHQKKILPRMSRRPGRLRRHLPSMWEMRPVMTVM